MLLSSCLCLILVERNETVRMLILFSNSKFFCHWTTFSFGKTHGHASEICKLGALCVCNVHLLKLQLCMRDLECAANRRKVVWCCCSLHVLASERNWKLKRRSNSADHICVTHKQFVLYIWMHSLREISCWMEWIHLAHCWMRAVSRLTFRVFRAL